MVYHYISCFLQVRKARKDEVQEGPPTKRVKSVPKGKAKGKAKAKGKPAPTADDEHHPQDPKEMNHPQEPAAENDAPAAGDDMHHPNHESPTGGSS